MPGTSPIRLGSATSGWTFESGSSVEESASGIQAVSVKALWPDGDTVLSNLPAAGASASIIDPSGFIPSTFLLDYTSKGPSVEYLEARIARATFDFKRQDPNRTGSTASRQVFADTVLNYDSQFNQSSFAVLGLGGTTSLSLTGQNPNTFGFPEPVVTVVYNTSTEPRISVDFPTLYALPGTAKATGFPTISDIIVPASFPVPAGALVTYFDGTEYQGFNAVVDTTFNFETTYKPHPRGWQLTNVKYSPVANRSFFDVEERWRNYYFFFGTRFIGSIPPIPP